MTPEVLYARFAELAHQRTDDVRMDDPSDLAANLGIGTAGVAPDARVTSAAFQQLYHSAVRIEEVRRSTTKPMHLAGHPFGGGLAAAMGVWFNLPATVFAPAPFERVSVRASSTDGLGVRAIVGVVLVLLVSASLTGCTRSARWEEHVQLGPNDTVVLERRARYKLHGYEVVSSIGWVPTYLELRVRASPGNAEVVWSVRDNRRFPVALLRVDGQLALLSWGSECRRGLPPPTSWALQIWDGQQWHYAPLERVSGGTEPNLWPTPEPWPNDYDVLRSKPPRGEWDPRMYLFDLATRCE
jgi:hypothetical protein